LVELATPLPVVRRSRTPARLGAVVPLACAALAAVLWIVTVLHADYASMGPLGLVTILGPSYFAGLALVCVGFAVELLRPHPAERRLTVLVVVLLVFLFGTPCAIEPVAATTSAFSHAGFVRYIFVHGHPLNGYVAEFSWPGVFSLFAVVASFMGKSQVNLLLRWFPLGIELAYLAPMLAIARASGVSRRAGWLGVALFFGTDWIYQDYFSPQAVNLLFYLATVALVLTCWRPLATAVARRRPALSERWAATRRSLRWRRMLGDESTSSWPASRIIATFLVLCLIFVASAISHQLTPYAIVLALGACLLTRRLGRPELLAIAFLLTFGWLSLGASDYWIGHLSQIFGGIFQFGHTAATNVSSRVVGSESHRLIIDTRILLTVGLFFLAGIGAARRATSSRTLELLCVAPFVVLVGQSYGGEGLLRVALLAGPFASLLAASAILPMRSGSIRPLLRPVRLGRHGRAVLGVATAVVLLGATVVMTVVRGGNDYYETFTTGELGAINLAYSLVTGPNQTIGLVAGYAPVGQWYVGTVNATAVAASDTVPTLLQIRRTLEGQHPTFIMLGPAQQHWGEVLGGYPPTWMANLRNYLESPSGGYVVVRNFGTATLLRARSGGT
jgi:hypothetical protein